MEQRGLDHFIIKVSSLRKLSIYGQWQVELGFREQSAGHLALEVSTVTLLTFWLKDWPRAQLLGISE